MLVAAIVIFFAWLSRHFVVDDGLIYARFLRNELGGQGLVYNPGETINALTSPLFSYVLLVTSWLLRGNILLAEHVLFALSFLCACGLAERLVPWSGVAVASTAYFYALIGLESTLFLAMLLLVLTAWNAKRYEWLPTLLALTLLTRFEGGLLIPVIGVLLWRERRIPRLWSFLPAAAIMIAWLALNHHWYGVFLPSSAASKFGQGRSGYWGRWPTAFLRVQGWAFYGATSFFYRTLYLVPLVLVFGVRGWRQLKGSRLNQVAGPVLCGAPALLSAVQYSGIPLVLGTVNPAADALCRARRAAHAGG